MLWCRRLKLAETESSDAKSVMIVRNGRVVWISDEMNCVRAFVSCRMNALVYRLCGLLKIRCFGVIHLNRINICSIAIECARI